MPTTAGSQFEEVYARDRSEWRAWLAARHADAPGAWLVYYKKGSGQPGVSYEEAVEEALCFGWIDSVTRTLDAGRYVQMFTPRKRKSPWAPSNKERVARLIEQGLMADAGLAAVEAAKADGRWDAYEDAAKRPMPDDLAAALAGSPEAERHFATYAPGTRRELINWVATAKRPATRQKRIATILTAAERRNPLAERPKEPPARG
jgi:uncharacterized protein YdeI (YjbR/CyaY-like superfamily)